MADLTIDFQPDGPTATYLTSGTPTRTRGATVSLELGFDPSWTGAGGYGTDYGSSYGTAGATGVDEYDAMVDRLAFVSTAHTGLSNDGVPWVVEDLPSRAPVSSQVLEVVPGADVQDIDAFWGVLVGGDDSSRPPRGLRTMTVELVFLADGDEYASRTALKNDLAVASL